MADEFEHIDAVLLYVMDSFVCFARLQTMHRFKGGVDICYSIHQSTSKGFSSSP